jgi:hypothetical protein
MHARLLLSGTDVRTKEDKSDVKYSRSSVYQGSVSAITVLSHRRILIVSGNVRERALSGLIRNACFLPLISNGMYSMVFVLCSFKESGHSYCYSLLYTIAWLSRHVSSNVPNSIEDLAQ